MKIEKIEPEIFSFEVSLTEDEKRNLERDIENMNFTIESHNTLHKFWNLLK